MHGNHISQKSPGNLLTIVASRALIIYALIQNSADSDDTY